MPPAAGGLTPYANLSGDSGVRAYRIRAASIEVQFVDGRVYVYDAARPGPRHVNAMKTLARTGRGLSTYISRHIRENYAAKRG